MNRDERVLNSSVLSVGAEKQCGAMVVINRRAHMGKIPAFSSLGQAAVNRMRCCVTFVERAHSGSLLKLASYLSGLGFALSLAVDDAGGLGSMLNCSPGAHSAHLSVY